MELKKRKICGKNNQKMLPVLDYSYDYANFDFEFTILPVFDCVREMPYLKYFYQK